MERRVLLVGQLVLAGSDRCVPSCGTESLPSLRWSTAERVLRTVGMIRKAMPLRVRASWEARADAVRSHERKHLPALLKREEENLLRLPTTDRSDPSG